MYKNALVVGCGSKLGADIAVDLQSRGYTVFGISGSDIKDVNISYQKIDWDSVTITECEKFLRKLPPIDMVLFNQNSPALVEECFKYNSIDMFEIWSRSKKWQQSHYVNCIMPVHFLQTLADSKKLNDHTVIVWMLSNAVIDHTGPVDYIGQKFQNLQILRRFAEYNQQIHIGIDPITLDAGLIIKFILSVTTENNGKFYSIDKTSVIERC